MDLVTALTVYGPMGVVLAWFMFRLERKIDLLTARIEDLTYAILLQFAAQPGPTPPAARELLDQISHDRTGRRA